MLPNLNAIAREVFFDYCGGKANLVDSRWIHGKSYGLVYLCECVPDWAYVGCHKNTVKPLGSLANKKLRIWRGKAHKAFDPLWEGGRMERNEAYTWLAGKLHVAVDKCHIAMFDLAQCKLVVGVVNANNR